MAAKIDNSTIQDGYNLYHHIFFFSENGLWGVIQQGMNNETNFARRYHWFSEKCDTFICNPQNGILGEKTEFNILNMVSSESINCQKTSVDVINDNPLHLKNDWAALTKHKNQCTLDGWNINKNDYNPIENLNMSRRINWKKMKEIYDFQPKNYEELISLKGIGSNTVRALALISDLIYGDKPSWSDPVKYSFTVGGKDGVPYPVDTKAMDESIDIIETGIRQAKVGEKEKINAIRRLKDLCIPS